MPDSWMLPSNRRVRENEWTLIEDQPSACVYLACSWQRDRGSDIAARVAQELDAQRVRVVGDIEDDGPQDDERIELIMGTCAAFLAVLPHRSDATTTSPYIVREIRIAAKLGLPMLIYHERPVQIRVEEKQRKKGAVRFLTLPGEEIKLGDQRTDLLCVENAGESKAALPPQLHDLVELVRRAELPFTPYVFMAVRLQRDFALARSAIRTATESATGLPCLCFDDSRISQTGAPRGERLRAVELIQNASVMVADLTRGLELPDQDSPNTAHEIGLALASGTKVLLCKQLPRTDPYFAAGDEKIIYWDDEEDLHRQVNDWFVRNRRSVGRRVFNYEITDRIDREPNVPKPLFDARGAPPYKAPARLELGAGASLLVALGFSLIAAATALLISLIGYSDTLDLAPLVAGIFTFAFATNFSVKLKRFIAEHRFMLWLVPVTGVALTVVWALLKPGAGQP